MSHPKPSSDLSDAFIVGLVFSLQKLTAWKKFRGKNQQSSRHADQIVLWYRRSTRNRTLSWSTSFAVLGFFLSTPVMADVLDISSDGIVTVYDRPAVFGPTGTLPIARTVSAPSSSGIGELISQAAARYALNPSLLHAVAWKESHFHNDAVSPKGAVGIMQLMPDTARALGVNRYDTVQNILGGAAYLRQMMNRYGEDASLALAAYNAGPGAVDRFGAVPPFAETRDYVSSILGAVPGPIQSPLPFVTLVSR